MTEAIGPGTVLICIDDRPAPTGYNFPEDKLTKHAIYVCEKIVRSSSGTICPWDGCSEKGIILEGKQGTLRFGFKVRPLYCPSLFRPLNDGDTSLVKDEINELERYKAPPITTPQSPKVPVKEPAN